jgi:hypothetical protein
VRRRPAGAQREAEDLRAASGVQHTRSFGVVGTFVVRLAEDRYVIWSNTVDAPVSHVMDRDALVEHVTASGEPLERAQQLAELADEVGLSDPSTTLDAVLATNRAGSGESRLSVADILRQYRLPE